MWIGAPGGVRSMPSVIGSGRMMIFIDGENLVFRYQESIEEGKTPRDDIVHIRDVFVWNPGFSTSTRGFSIIRANYYTSSIGSEQKLSEIKEKIRNQQFSAPRHGGPFINPLDRLPSYLSPIVFKRSSDTRQSKGVDIQMTVDILSHVYKNNVEAIYIMTGDGDFLPIIEEVLRQGKQVYLSAFSSGLNRAYPVNADTH